MKLDLNVQSKSLGLYAITALLVFGMAWSFAAPAAAQEESEDPARPTASGKQAYFPMIARLLPKAIPLSGDLVIDALEITQTVQNNANKIPLVAGKTTVMRVFTRTTASSAAKGVTIALSATRNNKPLAGSPLLVGPGTVPTGWWRGDISTSFNASLPAEWLSGEVSIVVTIDAKNNYIESDEHNNSHTTSLSFIDMPPLEVVVVPIEYNDPPSGLRFMPPSSDFLSAALMKVYPVHAVNVTRRESIKYGQDLTDERAWQELINRISELKRTDRARFHQVYYGLIPVINSDGISWFDGGLIGLGWVGQRTSMGLAGIDQDGIFVMAGDIAMHEIGHNLGREHAPCAVYPFDRQYPYHGGSIGQYGFNTSLMQVLAPEVYSDIMGYCAMKWVSDYTYVGLYLNQLQYGAVPTGPRPAGPGLLVRASIDQNGEIQLRPFYQLEGDFDPPADGSPYRLEYLDEAGGLVATYPLAELRAEEPQLAVRSIIALAPLPEKPYTAVRLSRREPATGVYQILAEKTLSPNTLSRQAALSLQAGNDRLVLQWGAPQLPALVRYSTDGGQRWTTVALDALGGQLELNRADLPTGDLLFELVLADSNTAPYRLEWQNQP